MPSFDGLYYGWVNNSVRVSRQVHEMQQMGKMWKIQVINHVYGRAGLRIDINGHVVYVADGSYLCPADGFMYTLLKDVSLKIWSALN